MSFDGRSELTFQLVHRLAVEGDNIERVDDLAEERLKLVVIFDVCDIALVFHVGQSASIGAKEKPASAGGTGKKALR